MNEESQGLPVFEPIKDLRERLRDERNSGNHDVDPALHANQKHDANRRDVAAIAGSIAHSAGPDVSASRGTFGTVNGSNGTIKTDERSTLAKSLGIRRTAGRPRKDYGIAASDTATIGERGTTRRARISAVEETPTVATPLDPQFKPEHARPEEKPPRQKKPPLIKTKEEGTLPWFKQKRTFSDEEAKELEEPLKEALTDYFQYMDDYIWYRTQDAEKMPVWSDADEDEVTSVARMFLKRAKHSPGAATIVRAVIEGDDYISSLMFFAPRMVESYKRLKHAPPQRKVAKHERRD